jgi:hypothetical protein
MQPGSNKSSSLTTLNPNFSNLNSSSGTSNKTTGSGANSGNVLNNSNNVKKGIIISPDGWKFFNTLEFLSSN